MTKSLQQQLREAVVSSLNNELYDNAVFLCERLFAENHEEEIKLLLAECYTKANKYMKAYEILANSKQEANRYKLASVCMKLRKYEEAENALLNKRQMHTRNSKIDVVAATKVPNGAAGLYLLGCINAKFDKDTNAIKYFMQALKLDPTLWCAYEQLAKLHVYPDIDKIFVPGTELSFQKDNTLEKKFCWEESCNEAKENLKNSEENKPGIDSPILEKEEDEVLEQYSAAKAMEKNYTTPQATNKNRRMKNIGSNAPQVHREGRLGGVSPSETYKENTESRFLGSSNTGEHSIRPFKVNTPSNVGNQSSMSKIREESMTESIDLMWLLNKFAHAYLKQMDYRCKEAISLYKLLPKNHYLTSWVLTQVGCCYLDLYDYESSEKVFLEMRKREPYTIEGLQYYSICLWQLKKQVELCSLSNFALKKNTLAPETWIIVGNCYSLQNEHEAAIKFFKRSIQLNKEGGMAYTLCGHEHFEVENYEEAEKCFRKGFTQDRRNYKAWWGCGNIELKQEKFDKALYNFEQAERIYPNSSFIQTYIGMSLMNLNQVEKALDKFEKSKELNQKSPLNDFMMIQAMTLLNQDENAYLMITKLINKHPKETSLYIHRGKLMKKMGKKEEALQDYNKALDLNPKDSNHVKNLIEKLNSKDDIDTEI